MYSIKRFSVDNFLMDKMDGLTEVLNSNNITKKKAKQLKSISDPIKRLRNYYSSKKTKLNKKV